MQPPSQPRHHQHHQPDQPGRARAGSVERVRLTHPRDLPAVVPYLLGFHPDDSVVVVALHRSTVALTMRLDLDAITDPDLAWQLLATPLTQLPAPTAGVRLMQVAVLGYGPADANAALLEFAAHSPVPMLDVLRVQHGRWWSLTCPNGESCCPPGELVDPAPPLAAPFTLTGTVPLACRDALTDCLQPGPPVLTDAVTALLPLDPAPSDAVLYAVVRAAHDERTDGPVPLDPSRAAILLHAIDQIPIRDRAVEWDDEAGWWLWTDLLHATPPDHVAPAATLLALVCLRRGDGTRARLAAEHALGADPDYRLAQLTLGLIEAGIHPDAVTDAFTHAVAELPTLPDLPDPVNLSDPANLTGPNEVPEHRRTP